MKVVRLCVRYRILAVCAIEGRLAAPWDRMTDIHDFLSAQATGEEWCPVDRNGARGQAERTHMTAPSTVAIPALSAPRFPTFHICLERGRDDLERCSGASV